MAHAETDGGSVVDNAPRRSAASRAGAALLAVVGCLVWPLWMLVLMLVLPAFVPVLVEKGIALPKITHIYMAGEALIRNYWFLLLLLWFPVTAGIVAAAALSSRRRTTLVAALWLAFSSTVAFLLLGCFMVSLMFPMHELWKALGH